MSTGLYENSMLLIEMLQREQYPATMPPFQYIVTTTPPPSDLQSDAMCLVLDPSSDEGLLLGRRFVGDQQVALR